MVLQDLCNFLKRGNEETKEPRHQERKKWKNEETKQPRNQETKKAGRVLCGASWGLLGSTESPWARAGRTVVVPGTTKIEKLQCVLILVAETLKSKR